MVFWEGCEVSIHADCVSDARGIFYLPKHVNFSLFSNEICDFTLCEMKLTNPKVVFVKHLVSLI